MNPQPTVTVVGIGDDGWHGLTEQARIALREARVIVGSARHLALLPDLAVRLPRPADGGTTATRGAGRPRSREPWRVPARER